MSQHVRNGIQYSSFVLVGLALVLAISTASYL